MIEFLAGLYAGVGICAGIAFYISDDPFLDEDGRVIKAVQASILAIGWLAFFVAVIGPMLIKGVVDWVLGGATNEQ